MQPGRRGIAYGVASLFVAVGFLVLSVQLGSNAAAGPSPAALHPATSMGAPYNAYYTSGDSYSHSSGSGCTMQSSSAVTNWGAAGSGVVWNSISLNPSPQSSCQPMWMEAAIGAGWHTCAPSGTCGSTFWAPSSSRLYNVSAEWSLQISVDLGVDCGSSYALYSELNVTLAIEADNEARGEGDTIPSVGLNLLHFDTRDVGCGTSPNDQTVVYSIDETEAVTVQAYLSSSFDYEFRSALQISSEAVADSTHFGWSVDNVTGTLQQISVT